MKTLVRAVGAVLVLATMAVALPARAQSPAVHLAVDDATTAEGDGTDAALTFTVRLSKPHPVAVEVPWSTVDGTAKAPEDHTQATGTARFAPGATKVLVRVAVVGDRVDEDDETMELRLGRPAFGRVEDGVGVGTIVDDDEDRTLAVSAEGGRRGDERSRRHRLPGEHHVCGRLPRGHRGHAHGDA
jgi:hypothetical protein